MKVNTILFSCWLIVLILASCASSGGPGAGGTNGAGGTHGAGGPGETARDSQEQLIAGGEAEPQVEEQGKPLAEERIEADALSDEAILQNVMPRMDPVTGGTRLVVQTLPRPVRQYEAAAGDAAMAVDEAESPDGQDTQAADTENRTAPAARDRQPDASDSTPRTAAAITSSAGSTRSQTSSAQSSGAQTVKAGPPTAEEQSEPYDDMILAAVGETVQISLSDHRWVFDRRNSDTGGGIEFRDIQYLQNSKDFIFSAENVGEPSL
ncbi:MAG: hypothetical protein ACP5IA_14290, partial [Sediminispirochaetaceae bacterium]